MGLDDEPAGDLASLAGTVPADGEVHLAVTGHRDEMFGGYHAEAGGYDLSVTPEPATLALVGLGAVGLAAVRRRRAS